MKTDKQGASWWKNLNSNSERNKNEKDEIIAPPENESKTKKLLESYKRMIEKNTELIRVLMTSFQWQTEQLDKLMIV